MDQKEGNGNFDMLFCAIPTLTIDLHPQCFIMTGFLKRKKGNVRGITHTDNGWILGHSWRWLGLLHAGMFFDAQVLHIAATEDDVLVNLIGRCYLLFRAAFAALCAVRLDVFEGYSRLVRVDFMENTNVTGGSRPLALADDR